MSQIEYTEIAKGITYTVSIMEDDQRLKGNVSAVDPVTDKKAEDWVYEQLDDGNLWACCVVVVKAFIEKDGVKFSGEDFHGGCSYRNKREFLEGPYQGMREEAKARLQADLLKTATRGTYAMQILSESFDLALLQG